MLVCLVGCAPSAGYRGGHLLIAHTAPGDTGLQSKDVQAASELCIERLLALPFINDSTTRIPIAIGDIENKTADPKANLDVFAEAMRVKVAQRGGDRIVLVEPKDRVESNQQKMLDLGPNGPGQDIADAAGRVQPEYVLYGRISELENHASRYFMCEYVLINLTTREQIPLVGYEVKTRR